MAPHIRPRETVDLGLQLSDLGVPDREIAKICGVAIKTVRRWRRLYQRRGLTRFGQRSNPARTCPRCDGAPLDSEAYSHLLGWYLGDGHIVAANRGGYRLEIFSDVRYPNLLDELPDSIRRVRAGSIPARRRRIGCVAIGVYWTHWPCLFPQHGPGFKHSRPITLEEWQRFIVEEHPGLFLRGLFHSDGCRITNWTVQTVAGVPKRYEYPRYMFSNRSRDILDLCSWALRLVGVEHRWPKPIHISVAKRSAVARLDEFVGPKS
jgi:Homeodomain-like domain